MEDLLNRLNKYLLNESINGNKANESEILNSYYKILDSWINDYESYRKNIAFLLNIFERYDKHSLGYSLYIFFQLYKQSLKLPILNTFDSSIIDIEPSENSLKNLRLVFDRSLAYKENIRISNFKANTEGFSDTEIKEMINLLIDKLQHDSIEKFNWHIKQVDSTLFQLAYLRAFCIEVNEIELFYYIINIFIDRLTTSEFYQIARDLSEEILISSKKDNLNFYGFFISFRVYSNQANSQAALIYGNLCLNSISKFGYVYSNKFLFEIVWQSLKFFRNVKLYPWAIDVYKSLPKSFHLTKYEEHSLDHSYFSCKLSMSDKTLTKLLFDYLNIEREDILAEGANGCIPWLMILYNMKRLNHIFDFSNSGLDFYIKLFENVVPSERIKNLKIRLFGNSEDLKVQLKESLLKLIRTRDKADFVYDNEIALTIANRSIEYGFNQNDIEAILLSMIIKSDYSIIFFNKKSNELAPIDLTEYRHDSFFDIYDNPFDILNKLKLNYSDYVIWVISSEDKLYQLTYNLDKFKLDFFRNWKFEEFQKWSLDKIPYMEFDRTIKDRYGSVRNLVEEDYELQTKQIINEIAFPNLYNIENANKVLLVKDMKVSELPHNLLLNKKNELIALESSITNIFSIEWLNLKLKEKKGKLRNDKSIFIPTEGGNLTINMLFSNIQNTLDKFNVKQFTSLKNISPINSTINIVSSHGNKDISSMQVFYPDDVHVIHNLGGLIGEGKILILLVCHSGSEKGSFYRNEINSVIKKFLSSNYEAVIAPFWSLHIDIPSIWLPIFLESMDNGIDVSNAVFKANKKVLEKYPTPAAWACMHLYGNPFFCLDKN